MHASWLGLLVIVILLLVIIVAGRLLLIIVILGRAAEDVVEIVGVFVSSSPSRLGRFERNTESFVFVIVILGRIDWLIVYGLLYRVVVRFIHNIIIWCKRGFRVCRQTLFFVQRRQGIIPILSEEEEVVVSNHILSRCEARHENKCLIAAIINR